MSWPSAIASALLALIVLPAAAQNSALSLPASVAAGSAFSIQTTGSGDGTLYIVGLGQLMERNVHLGNGVFISAGSLYNAGQYLVILTSGGATETQPLTVTPAADPERLSFLARPSRLPVGLNNGITGAVYVFDAYRNLITAPTPVDFILTSPGEPAQTRFATTTNGAAWTEMNSTAHQGKDKFVARAGTAVSTRIIEQVPGAPCSLQMTAVAAGKDVKLATAPVRDCSGNAVPDGTIVTFTEAYGNAQSTVDVPIKRDIAQVELPAHPGALISVASGVVMGNQIRWEK